ncbi:MAG: sensor histidine kinase [Verrucomicrobia bacterium]|nr:sensor histidine kinase [Verrucomicrobiota bacterium]
MPANPSSNFLTVKLWTLQQRLTLALSVLVLVVAGVFSLSLYSVQQRALMADIDNQLRSAASMARELVAEDYHDRISGPQSVSSTDYQRLADRYLRLCHALGIEYLRSLMLVDEKIVITTSTSPDGNAGNLTHSAFFARPAKPESYRAACARMTPTYQTSDDLWGRLRVVLLPFRDQQGRPYFYEAGMRLSEVDRQLHRTVFQCLLGGLALWGVCLVASVRLDRMVTRPLMRLTDTIGKIAGEHPGLIAEERGTYEQRMLASSFNRLNRALQDKITGQQHAQQALQESEISLRESLGEKELLLKEIHHRVKNNLQIISSLLRLQAHQIDNVETKAVLLDMQNRVHAMALIHKHLYLPENIASVDLSTYLKSLCNQLVRVLVTTPGAIQLHLNLAPIRLEIDQAIPCGLLVNELVSNALKHAFPAGRCGEVRVDFHALEDAPGWRLRVADNGVGLPPGFALDHLTSLGLKLASDLARQIGGRLELGTGPGAAFELECRAGGE